MSMHLANQKIIIIGGSSGMGLATAQYLANAGADVVIASRSQEKLQAALTTLSDTASAQPLDFTEPSQVEDFFGANGAFDHLVLMGAGMPAWGPFADIKQDALENAFRSKFWGYFFCAQAASRTIKPSGSMLFTIGAAARCSLPNTAGVAAVNGAILSMALTLAKELAPIRVNVLSPGLVDTPAYDWMSADEKQGFYRQMGGQLPVGRVGQAEEIAQAAACLLANTFTTGAVLDVDGGARLR